MQGRDADETPVTGRPEEGSTPDRWADVAGQGLKGIIKAPAGPADAGPVAAASATDSRCPWCAAALRPGAPWCTLCYADLRPPESVQPPPPVRQPAQLPEPLQVAEPAPAAPSVAWPCTSCAAVNPLDADRCAACGSGFLAALRESEDPLLVLPGVGDITRLDRSQRLLLSAGFVLVILVLTVLLGALLR